MSVKIVRVMPAKAGISGRTGNAGPLETPAFAGVAKGGEA